MGELCHKTGEKFDKISDMSDATAILLFIGFVAAAALWVFGFRMGSGSGFESGQKSREPKIASLQGEVDSLTDESKRLRSESREVERKRGENKRRSKKLDEREEQISETEERQREAERAVTARARNLRKENEDMEKREAARIAELETEKQSVQWAQEEADGVKKYYLQAARSAVPIYVGEAALGRECAGVYVVSREGAVKVGMTDDFSRRFKELHAQCRSVGIVDLRPEVLVPMDEGRRRVEERAHKQFEEKQTAGEWFAVSPDDAIKAVVGWAWVEKTENARHRKLRLRGVFDSLPGVLRKFAGVTALHLAAGQNDVPEIERLIRTVPFLLAKRQNPHLFTLKLREEDNAGHSPMDWAVGCNAPDAIAELVKLDSEYLKSLGGRELMQLAALKGARESIIALANLGLKVDAEKDDNGKTAMHVAANAECIDALVNLGADVNAADEKGNTPMHFARNSGVVDALVKNGADVNAENNGGYTPLLFAAERHSDSLGNFGSSEKESWIKRKTRGVVLSLMEHGANVTGLTKSGAFMIGGITLMHFAAQWNDVDLIAKLAARDKDLVEAKAENDWTPLHTAAGWDSADAVRELVRLGAFVESPTRDKWETPLHQTVHNGHVEAAKALLDNGADVNAEASAGTPLAYCQEAYGFSKVEEDHEEGEYGDLIQLLRAHGGVVDFG